MVTNSTPPSKQAQTWPCSKANSGTSKVQRKGLLQRGLFINNRCGQRTLPRMYKYKQVQQSNSCTIPAIEQEGNQINTDLNVTVTGTNSASILIIHALDF